MNRIVIATDGSASARKAVELGLELAAEQRAEAIAVHVVPGFDVRPGLGVGLAGSVAVPHRPTPVDRLPLEKAKALADASGVELTTELLTGEPVDEIVAFADSVEADLIVVGSHGRGVLGTALLGSVSRGILHESHRPVLVARGAATPAEAATPAP